MSKRTRPGMWMVYRVQAYKRGEERGGAYCYSFKKDIQDAYAQLHAKGYTVPIDPVPYKRNSRFIGKLLEVYPNGSGW